MFQVPAKTQYAIRALVHLAKNGPDSAARIAEAQRISPKYLEGILNQLKLSGIIISDRGRAGGYRLAREKQQIRMLEVVKSTEGEVRVVECLDDRSVCAMGGLCMPRKFWMGLKGAVEDYLNSVSLGDLAEDAQIEIASQGEKG